MAKKFSKIPSDYSKKNKPFASKAVGKKSANERNFEPKPKRYSSFMEDDSEMVFHQNRQKSALEKPKHTKPAIKQGKKEENSFERKNAKAKTNDFKKSEISKYKHANEPKSFEEKPKRKFATKDEMQNFRVKDFEAKGIVNKSGIGKKVEAEKLVESMPLNKFLAHCGICSRRDAVELIKKGKVKVNSLVEVNPAVKVSEQDFVIYDGKRMVPQRKLVYYLLNKPKDYITTTDDPEGRKTVLDLFKGIEDKRIFPVGRLDRNTTGLLLLTNDGELAQKLSHPKHNTIKVYQVVLDKPLEKEHFEQIAKGVLLEDGKAQVDEIAYINPKDKTEIGVQIHIGRNRIVRRLFEHFSYHVKALDRVVFAGLTKKNLPRGKWRELTPKEVIYLKHFK